jgi:hypothetical protein
MAVNVESYSEASESDRRAFDREDSQLVDLESYRPYLIDPTEDVPPWAPGSNSSIFVNQHIYFTETIYRQLDVPNPKHRNLGLIALRKSPYSQLVMRRHLEDRMHTDMETYVSPPPEDTVAKSFEDYLDIDIVGASSLSIHEVRFPKMLTIWEQNSEALPEIRALSSRDRLKLFSNRREQALDSLSNPRVISPELANSAIRRIANHLGDLALDRISNGRLKGNKNYYPVRVPKDGYLRAFGTWILKEAVGIDSVDSLKTKQMALQTGVNGVELVA